MAQIDITAYLLVIWHMTVIVTAGLIVSDIHNWPTVLTSNGPITGHVATNVSGVFEFLGIPYAEPPVGKLRFAPTIRYTGVAPYNASSWGFDCPQTTSSRPSTFPGLTKQAPSIIKAFATGNGNPQSEDCLTLNIWTSSDGCVSQLPKAVLVFFHGGRFTNGFVNSPFYNGKYLAAAEPVTVVTLTYRMNIFGFPGAPGEPQNLGLRDQLLALEWTRDNIASFGGDPTKITIFGQSAGGVAADWISYRSVQKPIAHGLILESGNTFSFPVNQADVAAKNWYHVSSQLGCDSSGDTLDCMRSKKLEDIKTAVATLGVTSGGSPLRSVSPFYPTIDNKFVFDNYTTRLESGAFSRIPRLIGSNDHEQGFYNISAYNNGVNASVAQGDQFLLESFTCPVAFDASSRRKYDVPVWVYRYFGDWDNTRLYSTSGAYHGTDLDMIFSTSEDVTGIPPTREQQATTRMMQRAWAAFANNPNKGLSDVLGWPVYDENGSTLIRLGFENSATPDFVRPSLYDAPCETVEFGSAQTAAP